MGLFSRKIEKQIASYQQELIETHYREVDNMYRQIRGWRHDYRNHIQTMKAYAAAQDWEAVKNYLDLLDTDLQTVDTVIKTGNPMTDAILNSKISLAKAKGIEVVADAHIPVKLKSSEIDLCCIIGNLFDNAIEASMKLPEEQRLIRVYMTAGKTSVFISHRLASTRFCDRIIFIADGNIAEEGTHESLLARGGAYAKLFEVQSRYYQEGKAF